MSSESRYPFSIDSTQWDAEKRIDWSLDLDPENPMELPDESISIYGSDV